jgi:hypothetical protein
VIADTNTNTNATAQSFSVYFSLAFFSFLSNICLAAIDEEYNWFWMSANFVDPGS